MKNIKNRCMLFSVALLSCCNNGQKHVTMESPMATVETPPSPDVAEGDRAVPPGAVAALPDKPFTGEIVFTTTGAAFSPIIAVDVTQHPKVLWRFPGGVTDTTVSPSVEFGAAAKREIVLTVNPWSALTGINLGYNAGDSGDDYDSGNRGKAFAPIALLPPQRVSDVRGLENVAPYLQYWSASEQGNTIAALDFSNFIALKRIECFDTGISKIVLTNTPSLKRLCLEGAAIRGTLDLTGCPNLEDLRATGNPYTELRFGAPRYPALEHLCANSLPNLSDRGLFGDTGKFPKLTELLINETRQGGKFVMPASGDGGVTLIASGNRYTGIDLSGALRNSGETAKIYFDNNRIEDVNIDGCVQITILDLSGNRLGQAAVDRVLETLDRLGRATPTPDLILNLGGDTNASPSKKGAKHRLNLEKKGWLVTTN